MYHEWKNLLASSCVHFRLFLLHLSHTYSSIFHGTHICLHRPQALYFHLMTPGELEQWVKRCIPWSHSHNGSIPSRLPALRLESPVSFASSSVCWEDVLWGLPRSSRHNSALPIQHTVLFSPPSPTPFLDSLSGPSGRRRSSRWGEGWGWGRNRRRTNKFSGELFTEQVDLTSARRLPCKSEQRSTPRFPLP